MKHIFASFLLFTGCLLAVGDSQRIPPHAQRNYEEYLDSVLGGADHEGTNRGDFLDYAYTGGRRPLTRPKQRRERRLDDDPDIYYDDEEYYYDYEEADGDDDDDYYYNDDNYDDDEYYDNDDDLKDEMSDLKDANDPIDNDLDPDDEEFLHDNMIHKDNNIRSKVKVGKANADARFKVKGKLVAPTLTIRGI
ncbi:spore coat protein SP60-like [Macrobrachium rosenbergii]|uniref:spore coat protein SP60-like n=1 Tax=Macrobrachium rosenbergii TaxID=79674 RepID=UPI0034D3D7BB